MRHMDTRQIFCSFRGIFGRGSSKMTRIPQICLLKGKIPKPTCSDPIFLIFAAEPHLLGLGDVMISLQLGICEQNFDVGRLHHVGQAVCRIVGIQG